MSPGIFQMSFLDADAKAGELIDAVIGLYFAIAFKKVNYFFIIHDLVAK